MAVEFDAVSSVSSNKTFSHVVSGPNPIIWVWVASENPGSGHSTSCTYGGVSMGSPIWSDGMSSANFDKQIEVYVLANCPTGTNNVVITGGTLYRAAAISYKGVNPAGGASSYGGVSGNSSYTGGSGSTTPTSASGDVCVSMAILAFGDGTFNKTDRIGSAQMINGGDTTDVNPTLTWSWVGNNPWYMVSYAMHPALSGIGFPANPSPYMMF